MSSKALKTIPTPVVWHSCPWKDFLPGQLPSDWHPVPHARITGYEREDGLRVIVSAKNERDGKMWLHVSYSRVDRIPDYKDTTAVKRYFIGNERYAIAIYPPKSQWVNDHEYCLHLWSCLDGHPLCDFRVARADGSLSI